MNRLRAVEHFLAGVGLVSLPVIVLAIADIISARRRMERAQKHASGYVGYEVR